MREYARGTETGTGLEAEGIFRISGKKAESDKLKEVLANKKADLSKIDPWEYCKSPHSIAALIRLYFREMKEPILTFELYDSFIAAESQKGAERLTTIGKLIEALPPKNKQLLSYFATFLNNVSKHSGTNKMVASNLSTIFAPSFMQPEVQSAEQLLNGNLANFRFPFFVRIRIRIRIVFAFAFVR
jgi:hypothetical protein